MTSSLPVELSRTECCDVTATMSSASNYEKFASSSTDTTASSDDGLVTSSADDVSRDCATQPITTDTGSDVSNAWRTTISGEVRWQSNISSERLLHVTSDDVDGATSHRGSSTRAAVGDDGGFAKPFVNASLSRGSLLPLALRSVAENASASAAVGSNVVDRRAGPPGLLPEEVATVGAAIAGVVLFWSLLALTMCAVVRVRRRKRRRRMRGSDVDAQTAMMEAMVRAELARGRTRVGDARAPPPTYVNVAELIPPSSSSAYDLDMADIFHFVLNNDTRSLWTKQQHNGFVAAPRSRDQSALWQDGSRTIQTRREAMCPATLHRSDQRCFSVQFYTKRAVVLNGFVQS